MLIRSGSRHFSRLIGSILFQIVVQFYGKPYLGESVNVPSSPRFKRQNYDPYANDRFSGNNQVDPYNLNQGPRFESFRLFGSLLYGKKFNLLVQVKNLENKWRQCSETILQFPFIPLPY